MAELIGATGSTGMLLLIGLLILSFLKKTGLVKRETARAVVRVCLWTLCAEAGYFLFLLLCRQTVYGDLTLDVFRALGNGYIRGALDGLERPTFMMPLTGIMSWMGHVIGDLLFGQRRLAGFLLSFLCTTAGVLIFRLRIKKIFGDQAADDGCFLLLCDPCAVFFFFPCGVPLVLLGVCIVFSLAARRVKPRAVTYSRSLYGWVQAIFVTLSAAVACGVALGRIG